MPPDLKRRYERLLLRHPQWESRKSRRALFDALRDHDIYDDIEFDGAPAEVAAEFTRL